ncbi:MAG: CDP-diacylglycerol--glycerol-3-phosphate 3-phosphatidyltransferase [Spirochaetaceae bacterium]
MTLPNKLTITRIVLAPVFILMFFLPNVLGESFLNVSLLLCWLLFLYGEVSDVLDGYIARKRNLVSDLGKIMDPFADVVSRLTYFYCFVLVGVMPSPVFYIILLRELIVTFIRMVLIKSGTAMAASMWGKAKAVIYFISSMFAFIYYTFSDSFTGDIKTLIERIVFILFVLSAISALGSLLDYLTKFSKTDVCKGIMAE